MKKLVIAFGLVVLSSAVQAGGSVGWNKVTKIAFHSNGLYLYADNWSNPNGCQQVDAVVLKDSDPNYDKAYALLLAAYMSGQRVNAYSDGCHTFDEKTYNHIRGFKYLQVTK